MFAKPQFPVVTAVAASGFGRQKLLARVRRSPRFVETPSLCRVRFLSRLSFPSLHALTVARCVAASRTVVPLQQFLLMAFLSGLTSGCSTVKPPEYSSSAAPSNAATTTTNATLRVTVDPFFDAKRSDTYFKVNALKQGIVVLNLRFENASLDTTYLVHKDNLRFVTSSSDGEMGASGQKIDHSTGAGDAVAISGAVILGLGPAIAISLPLMFIGGQMVADAEAVRQNFVSKELQNRTLAPGQSLTGFVYFVLPKNQTKSGSATFRVRVPATNGREAVELEFPLNYENR